MDEQSPIFLISQSLRELYRSFSHATREDAESCNVTHIQFLAMKRLHQHPEIGLNELAEWMHAGASTVSGVVDRLVQAGWVSREKAPADRRAVMLRLTPEGETLLGRVNAKIMKRLSPLLQLPEEDVRHLLHIHQQIITSLQENRTDEVQTDREGT